MYGNLRLEDGRKSEGKDVRVFVDTGANVNSTFRRQFVAFLDENLDLEYVEGPFGGLVMLVGGKTTLHVQGDKVRIET